MCVLRHLKTGESEHTMKIGRWGRTEGEASHSAALTAAQDWGAVLTVQSRGAETAVRSGRLAHAEWGWAQGQAQRSGLSGCSVPQPASTEQRVPQTWELTHPIFLRAGCR